MRNEIQKLKNQNATLDYENRDLNEKRLRHEGRIRSLQEDIKRSEVELQRLTEELHKYKQGAEIANDQRQELDAARQRIIGEIDALKQERSNLNKELGKQNGLLQKANEDKLNLERDLSERTNLVARRETQIKTVSQELNKANDIIKQFQEENRKQNNRVKKAQETLLSQQQIIEKKDHELEDVRNQLKEENESNRTWKYEKNELLSEMERYKQELEQLR